MMILVCGHADGWDKREFLVVRVGAVLDDEFGVLPRRNARGAIQQRQAGGLHAPAIHAVWTSHAVGVTKFVPLLQGPLKEYIIVAQQASEVVRGLFKSMESLGEALSPDEIKLALELNQ